jgi:hypothetical protein
MYIFAEVSKAGYDVNLVDAKFSFGEYMKEAQCKINKAGLPVLSEVEGLIEACNLIDQMKIAEQNPACFGGWRWSKLTPEA